MKTMTDNKPLITYAGEIPVFQSVVPSLQKGIGAEAVEWKRAYGRSTKRVHLHPRFIPFEPPDPLNAAATTTTTTTTTASASPITTTTITGEKVAATLTSEPAASVLNTLLDQPMLHTFWTDCSDVELYRSTTKDVIQSWLNSVKNCNIKEWLIILVEPSDNKRTNKLLPRSSVLDKIKNDFAQKQTERCVCLLDPGKIDSKSAESLNSMLHRIRQLMLSSYSKTLTKFEENMRAQREKRNESGWNFCHYFLLQEELAFVLEMLEVYDESLVQYDELDALFTQFVLNSHFTDTPKWLLSFQRFGDRWPALSLSASSSQILHRIRESITNSTVSLLNFRNYLFSRQVILLMKQQRYNELAQRSLAFLHVCINELNILDVTFSEEGSISCWVFVSCLEILGTIQTSSLNLNCANNDSEDKDVDKDERADGVGKLLKGRAPAPVFDFSVHTASLWDYAREKLYELGKLCGLLPKSELKSDHLHKVITLAAGLSPFEDFPNGNGNNSDSNNSNGTTANIGDITLPDGETPIEKLKNALSSKERFQQNYLELCELATGTYKHIGRLRSARKVGLSLASYYVEAGEYTKAIVFLTDAYNTFKDDKWSILVIDVLFKLAQCYQAINDNDRYIRTCAQIACSKSIAEEQRHHYFDEMMNCLTKLENNDRFIMSPTEETFLISSVNVDTSGKINGISCDVAVELLLVSNLPRPLLSNLIQMAIIPCDHVPKQVDYTVAGMSFQGENINKGKGSRHSNKRATGRKDSTDSNNSSTNEIEKVPLTRKESVTPVLTCEDEDVALAQLEMNFNSSAAMKIDMRQQLESDNANNTKEKLMSGRLTCHNMHQSLRRKDSSQVQGEQQVSKTDFTEAAKTNDIIINPGANKLQLFAKVSKAGNYRLAQVSIGVKHFELLSPRLGCRYRFSVQKEPPNIELQSRNLIAGIEQLVTITLMTGSYSIQEDMFLQVRASLGLKLKGEKDSAGSFSSEMSLKLPMSHPFSSTTVNLCVKADLGSQKEGTAIDHKIIVKCPWTNEEKKLSLSFVPPFTTSHKLHSVGQRKFIQILLIGNSSCDMFKVSEHQLTVQSPNAADIPLVSLNPRSQSLLLDFAKSAAYMWEIGVLEVDDELQPLRLEFSITFKTQEREPELYKHYICLQRFKTLYELKSKVEPHKGTEFCRVGNMSQMIIEISKFSSTKEIKDSLGVTSQPPSLMYEVRADQHMWAICGRSSGVVSLDDENESTQTVSLDVMPMSPGYLPFPTVHISKYIPADQKSGSSNVPKLEPFNAGQVYNKCKGSQVHVLPPPQTIGSSSSGGLSGGGSSGGSLSTLGGGSSLPMSSDHF